MNETIETPTDHVRALHELALHARITLSLRAGTSSDPTVMGDRATGAAAAWYVHRLLDRLAELDPHGIQAFATELREEGEMPGWAADPVETAERLGFDAQGWVHTAHSGPLPREEQPKEHRHYEVSA